MHFVYLVGPGDDQEPLRYSLRTLQAHAPDHTVTLAGYQPDWTTNTGHLPVEQERRSWANQIRILRHVCEKLDSSFILMNDDFFALQDFDTIALHHNGTLEELANRPGWSTGWYGQSLTHTRTLLHQWGFDTPLAYDGIHRPMPINPHLMDQLFDHAESDTFQHRSLYGNHAGPSTFAPDTKLRSTEDTIPKRADWISTSPRSWHGRLGATLRATYPTPCRYEYPTRR